MVPGVRSSVGLDQAGRRTVSEHLKSCGAEFRPARKSGLRRNPPEPPPETARQIGKIRAMLAEDGLPTPRAPSVGQQQAAGQRNHGTEVPQEADGEVVRGEDWRRRRLNSIRCSCGGECDRLAA